MKEGKELTRKAREKTLCSLTSISGRDSLPLSTRDVRDLR